ncbi:carbohydrate-binding family 9-like protein [Paenibacillus sp. CAU 1782]
MKSEEKRVLVPRAAKSLHGAWADEQDGNQIAIDHYQWETENGYTPTVLVSLSYTAEEIQVRFRVYEGDPLVRFTEQNDPVHRDSCVEFFVQPMPELDERYLNFELNAAGTLTLGLGKGLADRVYLTEQESPQLHISTETQLRDGDTDSLYWTARFRIPTAWVAEHFPGFRTTPGVSLRGNFYKCGDETPSPHYGSWSPVTSETPSFHRSIDFGLIVLD